VGHTGGTRPRWAGPSFLLLGLGAVAFAIAVTVSAEQQLAPALALLAGMLGGLMLTNVWAIRAARANRQEWWP